MDIINISIIYILLLMIIISLLIKRYYSNYNKIKKLKYNKSDVETFYAGIYSGTNCFNNLNASSGCLNA